MSSACFGAFAQRIAGIFVLLEVAVAREGVFFQNMKVLVLPRLYTAINLSFPFVPGIQTKIPIGFLLTSLIKRVQHALRSSTLRRYSSHLRHKSSLSLTHRLPRTLELMAATSSTKMLGIRMSILNPLSSKRRRTQSTIASSCAISTSPRHSHKPRNPPSIHDDDDADLPGTSQVKSTQRIVWQNHGQAKPTTTRTGF